MSILDKMNLALSGQFEAHPIHALFAREFRAALINRYFQVFCALALIGGIAAAVFAEDTNAAAVFDLQLALYFSRERTAPRNVSVPPNRDAVSFQSLRDALGDFALGVDV